MSKPLSFVVVFFAVALGTPFTLARAGDADPLAGDASDKASSLTESRWSVFRGSKLGDGLAATTLPDRPAVVWRYEVENGAFDGTPAIVDGVVYIGDLDGSLYALKLSDGSEIWTYTTDSGFTSATAVKDDRVYIGDYDGRLHCVDAKTGKKMWDFESQAEISAGANFHKDHVLFGSQDSTLYCVNAKDGKLVWQHSIQDQIRCAPTIVEGRVFLAGCDGLLHIVDVEKGEGIASVPINAPTGATPAVRGAFAYFGTEAGEVFSVDWRNAKVQWVFSDTRRGQPFRSSAAVNESIIVVGGRSKMVYGLDPQTGEEVWSFATKRRVDSSPVIVGDRAFVGSGDGKIYALHLKDGRKTWEYDTGGGFVGSPAVADQRLVIANEDGVVYCFGSKGNTP